MKKIFQKLWPIFFLLTLWFIFSGPYFLFGKVPFPSTYLSTNYGPWNEYGKYIGPVKNAATPDVITQIYPWKQLVVESLKNSSIPFWNPYSFSGTPLLANYQSASLSPLNLVYLVLPFIDAWSIQVLLAPLLAGVFMYIFLRVVGIGLGGSVIGAMAFMFSGFITTWMMYGTLSYAILFLPLSLFAIEKFYRTGKWYYITLLTFSVPLSFLSGHFQTSLYYLLFLVCYLLFKFLTTRNVCLFFLNILSIGFGLLISAPQLLPSIELYFSSVRSEIFLKTEVIPWRYFPTFLAPDIFGNPVTRNAWFGHYAEWNAYIGLIPLILGFYSLRKKNSYILFFFFAALFAILFAFQTPILDLLITLKIPVLSTSAASRIIVLFSFSAAVLAGFGFDNLISDIKERNYKKIAILLYCFIAVFVIFWGAIIFKVLIPQDKVAVAASNLKLPSAIFISFIIILLCLHFCSNLFKTKRIFILASAAIIFFTASDLLRFAKKWQPFEDRSLVYPDVPISKFLSGVSGHDRSFGNFGQELSMMFRLPSLEGYDPLYIARFGEFLNAARDGNFHQAHRSVATLSKNAEFTGKILNFLGVKYIIHKVADGRAIWAFPFWEYPIDQFRTVYRDDKYQIFENDKALPRAFLVQNYKVISDNRAILRTIFREDLDLRRSVVLEENPLVQTPEDENGSAKIIKYEQNNIQLKTTIESPAILVLTDPFYPGWRAYVDGSETRIFRANYAFRAIVVPSGIHTVAFTYEPNSFKIGTGFAFLGLLGVLGEGYLLWRKKFRF